MNKYFVFDMNGVIKKRLDYERLIFLLKSGLTFEEFYDIYSRKVKLVETGKITDDEFFNDLINTFGLNYSVEEVKSIFKRCFNDIYKSTLNVILKLKSKGYKVCMFSSLKRSDYECLQEIFDVSLFDKLYLSYEIGYDKTDEESFTYLINDLEVLPQDIYFFDDRLSNVTNARNVGINAYQVTGETIEQIFLENNLYSV